MKNKLIAFTFIVCIPYASFGMGNALQENHDVMFVNGKRYERVRAMFEYPDNAFMLRTKWAETDDRGNVIAVLRHSVPFIAREHYLDDDDRHNYLEKELQKKIYERLLNYDSNVRNELGLHHASIAPNFKIRITRDEIRTMDRLIVASTCLIRPIDSFFDAVILVNLGIMFHHNGDDFWYKKSELRYNTPVIYPKIYDNRIGFVRS